MAKRRADSPTHQRLYLFAQKWEEHYVGETYAILWGMDMKWMKELEEVPMDTIAERLDIYFKDGWYNNCKHSLQAFVKNFNKFIPQKTKQHKPSNLPKQKVVCVDCGKPFDFDKRCENPDCKTNEQAPVSKDAVAMVNSLFEHFKMK